MDFQQIIISISKTIEKRVGALLPWRHMCCLPKWAQRNWCVHRELNVSNLITLICFKLNSLLCIAIVTTQTHTHICALLSLSLSDITQTQHHESHPIYDNQFILLNIYTLHRNGPLELECAKEAWQIGNDNRPKNHTWNYVFCSKNIWNFSTICRINLSLCVYFFHFGMGTHNVLNGIEWKSQRSHLEQHFIPFRFALFLLQINCVCKMFLCMCV